MSDKFEAWGICELMGHQRAAGRLTEEMIGGSNMLRIDIPNGEGFRTAYYGSSAIYAVHITDEAAARQVAANIGARPPYAYELSQAVARIAPTAQVYDDQSDDDDNPFSQE